MLYLSSYSWLLETTKSNFHFQKVISYICEAANPVIGLQHLQLAFALPLLTEREGGLDPTRAAPPSPVPTPGHFPRLVPSCGLLGTLTLNRPMCTHCVRACQVTPRVSVL